MVRYVCFALCCAFTTCLPFISFAQTNYGERDRTGTIESGKSSVELYHRGIRLIESERVEEGIKCIEQAAKDSSLISIRLLIAGYGKGHIAFEEKEVPFPKDYDKYMYWLRRATALGDTESMFLLARNLYTTDSTEAFKWFQQAAKKDFIPAYHWVGMYYRLGIGDCKQDNNFAEYWFRKGAEKNELNCMFALSDMLCKDIEEHYVGERQSLLEKSAAAGYQAARAELLMQGIMVNGIYEYIPRLRAMAKCHIPRAMAHYGYLLIEGIEVKQDLKRGKDLLDKAAFCGDEAARYWIKALFRDASNLTI